MHLKFAIPIISVAAVTGIAAFANGGEPGKEDRKHWQPVSGSGVHYLSTALVHSKVPTTTGMVQRSTDVVDLQGDLAGRILYHPRSTYDFAAGTLVNTGHQVFSGTILGSEPVMLHDDEYRFAVDLNTGATTGRVHLVNHIAGRRARCHLDVTGTGMTAAGDALVTYTGRCRLGRNENPSD